MTTPTLIRKTWAGEIKAIDEARGIVTAFVNSLDVVDHDQEVIAPGAFNDSIARSLPAVAWMHDQTKIVGGVMEAKEERKRLLATMQFDLDTEPGAYAFKMVARGRVKEWSVGFYANNWRMEERDQKAVRVIESVEWVEVSPVLKGASPGTQTVDAKSVSTPEPETPTPEPAPAASDEDAAGTDAFGVEAARLLALYREEFLAAAGLPSEASPSVKSDMADMQTAHDLMVRMGAKCSP